MAKYTKMNRRVYVPNLEQKIHYRNEKHAVRRSGLCLAFEAQRWQESQEIQWWKKKTCKNWLGETWWGPQTFIKHPFLCNMQQSSSPAPYSFQSETSGDRCRIYELTFEQSRERATTTQSKKHRRKQTPMLSLLTKYGLSTSSCYRAPASISEEGCYLTATGLDPNTSHGSSDRLSWWSLLLLGSLW
jgi:hypothetical protein